MKFTMFSWKLRLMSFDDIVELIEQPVEPTGHHALKTTHYHQTTNDFATFKRVFIVDDDIFCWFKY